MPKNNDTCQAADLPTAAIEQELPSAPIESDLRSLTVAITSSGGLNQLAVDILVNLAAIPCQGGRTAQTALRRLYEHPESGDLQVDENIRAELLSSARRVCEFALVTAPALNHGPISLPLSVMVASMGAQCPIAAGGCELTGAVRAHLERRRSAP